MSLVDLHIIAWFSRILHLAKASRPASTTLDTNYTGFSVLQEVISQNTGDLNFEIESKLRDLCITMMNRKSWDKVYQDGLH